MALVLKDRVQETTTVTGTGTVTLLGAVAGYSSFSTIGNGNTTMYCIYDGTSLWEAGIGTYTLSGTTLSRDTVLANSSGNTSLISFTSGSKTVICGLPAEKAVYLDASGNTYVPNLGATTTSTGAFSSLGVGTAASGTTGEIRATNNITAYYSDENLKTKVGDIENALDKLCQIETMLYHANETAVELGYDASIMEVGVTAQSVQKVQPEIVVPAPIDDKYLTVRYERLTPLIIEAIKELRKEVETLKTKE